jgi:hypothetical protein
MRPFSRAADCAKLILAFDFKTSPAHLCNMRIARRGEVVPDAPSPTVDYGFARMAEPMGVVMKSLAVLT